MTRFLGFLLVGLLLSAAACQAMTTVDPTEADTGATDTTDLATDEATESPDPTDGATGSPDPTDGATQSPDPTSGATRTPQPTSGATVTPEPTGGATGTPQPTGGATVTPEPTGGATGTPEPTGGATGTPEPTGGATGTPEPTGGATGTPEPTGGATGTPEPTSGATTPQTTVRPPIGPAGVPYEVTTLFGSVVGVTYTVVRAFSDISDEDAQPFNTKNISKFLGVPYAQAPVGSLRFQEPVAFGTYNDTVNATQFKPNCPQDKRLDTSEDCLHFNVWTPRTPDNSNATYPVLLWIHGGRFEAGGSNDGLTEGEEIVIHENVVVVTFNYRLGALGFLSLNGTDFGGNLGILDQRLAIKTIRDIIPSYGGDPDKITLMGLDAGSASIGFHMMDSTTSSLFSNVIMMGGSPMMPWSLVPDVEHVQLLSLLFSVGLNCSQTDKAQRQQCLQDVPISKLIDVQKNFTRLFQGLEFSPIVDGKIIAEDPWYAFSSGNFNTKPILLGATNEEGANIVEDGLEASNIPIDSVTDQQLVDLVQESLSFFPRASQTLSAVGRSFLRLHFTNRGAFNNGKRNFKILSEAVGDWYLTCPVTQMADFADNKTSSVYLYYFTEKELNQNNWEGASHGVDALYAFGIPTKSAGIAYPPEKKTLSERIMRQFVSFADSAVPETDPILWKPYNKSGGEMNYIDYNANSAILGNKMYGYRVPECHFWNRTFGYVNGLQETPLTPRPPVTTSSPSTTRNPIGPNCAWAFTESTGTVLGVLGATQIVTAVILVYFIIKWKSLARVADQMESIRM